MLIHVSPRLYIPDFDPQLCELVDWTCPELGLHLVGGVDVVARRPYPNKNYLVACRKLGQRAMDGLLVEVDGHVGSFTATTRWRIGTHGDVVSHVVNYSVLDEEMDAVTDDMVLWSAFCDSMGGWRSRMPSHAQSWTCASARPRMEIKPTARQGDFADLVHVRAGRNPVHIERRVENFAMHTVERDRLLTMGGHSHWDRLPSLDQAYRVAKPS